MHLLLVLLITILIPSGGYGFSSGNCYLGGSASIIVVILLILLVTGRV